jgi:hypothetical protein
MPPLSIGDYVRPIVTPTQFRGFSGGCVWVQASHQIRSVSIKAVNAGGCWRRLG